MHLHPTSKLGYLSFKASEKAFVCIQNDSNHNSESRRSEPYWQHTCTHMKKVNKPNQPIRIKVNLTY